MGYLKDEYPKLYNQLDKNDDVDLTKVTSGSHKKLWWKCDKGHIWQASVKNRTTRKSGCPYCSGHKVFSGFNDLNTTHKYILQQWSSKNKELNITPYEVSSGSHKKVWWECPKGHEYIMAISRKIRRPKSCPVCSGYKVICGTNDIASQSEKLSTLWDNNKNTVKPTQVLVTSTKKYWWICDKKHSWLESPSTVNKDNIGCPYCSGHRISQGFNDLATTHPELLKEWDYDKNTIKPEEVSFGSNKKAWWLCNKEHSYSTKISKRTCKTHPTGCPKCSKNISQLEQRIVQYLQQNYNKTILTNNRSIIPPLELDIYIPDANIAIEFNGLYWHSEKKGKDKRYHYDKWLACKEKGIQLITIWEDDWINNQETMKQMLLHKLGVSRQGKVFARKTTVMMSDLVVTKNFCNANHIQGFTSGSLYLGLKDENYEIIAVTVWKKYSSELRLERYCTSKIVIGGLGKLLKSAKQWAIENDCTKIITFSDNEISDGSLYEKLGFVQDKILAPDYKYVYKNTRIHKFNFRLKRFKNDPELEYDPSMTERELALLNDIPRVWDCGKIKWVIEI